MKSIRTQAIRRANLKRLVDCIGSQKELARILDMNPSHINTMLRGKRTITGKAARRWKNGLGWNPAGSMTIRTAEDRCAQTRTNHSAPQPGSCAHLDNAEGRLRRQCGAAGAVRDALLTGICEAVQGAIPV